MLKTFLLIILFVCSVYSQSMIDSLRQELNNSKDDIEKIGILNRLSFEYIWQNTDTAITLANQSVKLSEANEYRKGLPSAYRSLSLAEKLKGNFDKAIEYTQKAIALYDEFEDTSSLAISYKDLGDIYHSQGEDEPKSVEYLLKALRLAESIGDKKTMAACFNNIALAYKHMENYDKAIEYHHKSIELKQEMGNRRSLVFSYANLGVVYNNTGLIDEGIEYYLKALDIAEDFGNKVHLAAINENLGLAYKDNKEFNKARRSISKALEYFSEIDDGVGIAISYYNLAELSKDQKNYSSGLNFAKRSLEKSLEINSAVQIMDSYKIYHELYSLLGNYKQAYEYLKLYKDKNESIFNEEKHEQIAELQTKYETEKKQQQIALLEKEQQLNAEVIEKQEITIYFIIGMLLVSVVFTITIFRQYKKTAESNKALVKKNLELMQTETSIYSLKKNQNKFSDDTKLEILDKLNTYIEDKKIFKTPKLSIDNLAKELDTNRTYLSEIINDEYGTNFNQFINSRRVIEARKMLVDTKYEIYTIESIAEEVGFSSKSVFNESFKKFTGISPSFFRQNALKKSA